MYHVSEISLLLLIHPFSSLLFFLSNFQTLKILSHFFLRNRESWKLVHTWTMGGCIMYTANAAAAYLSFFYIFLSLQDKNFSSYFSQERWDLDLQNFLHMWTVSGCIVYTAIKLLLLLLLVHPFISSFFFLSSTQTFKFFITFFSRTAKRKQLKQSKYEE